MDSADWDIRREGHAWTKDVSQRRLYQAPEKIEFVGGIFASERERLTVLGMVLENLGIDKAVTLGNLADWKAAISDRAKQQRQERGPDEVLGIAHQDACAAYRDLSGYRIALSREEDGWHVDYQLSQPDLNGGGPHYVIDPHTGAIKSKRFDQ